MDRAAFRRMATAWVSEIRLAHSKLLGTFYRPSTSGGAAPG